MRMEMGILVWLGHVNKDGTCLSWRKGYTLKNNGDLSLKV